MKKMLYITTENIWPVTSGGRKRVAEQLSIFSKYFEITLIYSGNNPDLELNNFHIEGSTSKFKNLFHTLSFMPKIGLSLIKNKYRQKIQKMIDTGKYDYVFFTHSYLAPLFQDNHHNFIVDFPNIEFTRQKNFMTKGNLIYKALRWIEYKKSIKWEEKLVKNSLQTICVTQDECRQLNNFSPKNPPILLSNASNLGNDLLSDKEHPNVLYVCNSEYTPNANAGKDFIEKIWPKVYEKIPTATFTIVGKGSDTFFSEVSNKNNVIPKGFVKNIEDEYRSATVVVSPVKTGGGSQLKVLEALANTRLTLGPPYLLKTIPDELKKFAFTSNTDSELANLILDLLTDYLKRHQLEKELILKRQILTWETACQEFIIKFKENGDTL